MCKSIACSIFGHRKILITEELIKKIRDFIEGLIVYHNVSVFLFGSASQFDSLCHTIVTELKEKYPFIKRVKYTCKSEGFTLESERAKEEAIFSRVLGRQVHLAGYEEEVEHKTKFTAGKSAMYREIML
ncbi:MAG: hypothetical protein IJX25_00630 [Clostridia bacterium]|nr:hypothetical protein [Clostridia bacterium]